MGRKYYTILERKYNQIRNFILSPDKKKGHRSYFILYGYRSVIENYYKRSTQLGILAYFWDYCFIPASIDRYRTYSAKGGMYERGTGYGGRYYYRKFMKDAEDLGLFLEFTLPLLGDYIAVYSYYYRKLMNGPYYRVVNVRDNLNLNDYGKGKKKKQINRLNLGGKVFLKKNEVIKKKEFQYDQKQKKYEFLLDYIKKKIDIPSMKDIFGKEIPELYNFEEIVKLRKGKLEKRMGKEAYVNFKVIKGVKAAQEPKMLFEELEKKNFYSRKKVLGEIKKNLKKKNIKIEEKMEDQNQKLEREVQRFLMKDIVFIGKMLIEYNKQCNNFREKFKLEDSYYKLSNYDFLLLDFFYYKMQRALFIRFYLLFYTYKKDNKIDFFLEQSKLFNLFLHINRDKQNLEQKLLRRISNIDLKYKAGLGVKSEIYAEIYNKQMYEKMQNYTALSSIKRVGSDINKRIRKSREFKRKNLLGSKNRSKLNTLISNRENIKRGNKKRSNYLKFEIKKIIKESEKKSKIDPLLEIIITKGTEIKNIVKEKIRAWFDFHFKMEARALRDGNIKNIKREGKISKTTEYREKLAVFLEHFGEEEKIAEEDQKIEDIKFDNLGEKKVMEKIKEKKDS